jgi:dCTP deaminase
MWNDQMIMYAIQPGAMPEGKPPIVTVPWDRREIFGKIEPQQIQPASLDVRLAADFIRHPDGQRFGTDARYPYVLSPGDCVLGCLLETFEMPNNVVARVEGKSSWARRFLTVHAAGFIDPGFKGDITLELKNDGWEKIELHPGVTIAQISFETLDAPALRPYGIEILGSHYQGQKGPTPSCD